MQKCRRGMNPAGTSDCVCRELPDPSGAAADRDEVENQSDDHERDADGPKNVDLHNEPHDEQDDSETDYFISPSARMSGTLPVATGKL